MRPRPILRPLPRLAQRSSWLRTMSVTGPVRSIAARPQLPFLSVPSTRRIRVRFLTTQRKEWLKHEVKRGVRYTVYFWTALACFFAGSFAVNQEILERQYPTPREWSFVSRTALKKVQHEKNRTDMLNPDWLGIILTAKKLLERLEDPTIDGRGLQDVAVDNLIGVKDISDMPEPWRRGYVEVLMLYAAAAEKLDGWVVDRTRDVFFPPEMVLGPSNPRPKPIPPGAKSAPREENCEVAFASPHDIYLKIIHTKGKTCRQHMDAALAYASYLEHKGEMESASRWYSIAIKSALESQQLDGHQGTLSGEEAVTASGWPKHISANYLTAVTAEATFRARCGDVTTALPTLVRVLKARRSLPEPNSKIASQELQTPVHQLGAFERIASYVQQPPYPPPPPDGSAPPVRDASELCQEAALQLHIGEILYAARSASREEGLAWTREAVDVAEEQLRKLSSSSRLTETDRKSGQTTCRECLSAGMQNWTTMVARMASGVEATHKEKGAATAGWLGLWGTESGPEIQDRWKAEEAVIQERIRRVAGLLEDLPQPPRGWNSWLAA